MKIIHGDCFENLKKLETESIDCIVTSPPYWQLRDYETPGQIGLEENVEGNVNNINGNIIAKVINGNCKTINGDILCND